MLSLGTSVTSVRVPTLDVTVAQSPTLHKVETIVQAPNPILPVNLNTGSSYYPLPTPVNANKLEEVLAAHPDHTLVNQ